MEKVREIIVWLKGRIIPVELVNLPDATTQEARCYAEYVQDRIKAPVESLRVEACADGKVDVHYCGNGEKFERIRRITGYLGELKTWNNAKQAEESERVKHQ